MSFGRLGSLGRGFCRLGGLRFGTAAADTTAPTITSASSANCEENATLAHTLTANEGVSWSIVSGADLAKFEISGSTLRWLANGTKDFEAPDDADTNNAYVVGVRATDSATNTADQTITITVTDVAEGGAFTFENAGIAIQATNGVTSTFTAKPIGTAATGRKLLIFVIGQFGGGTTGLSGVTVDGNAATLIGSTVLTTSYALGVFMYQLDAGTTANIVASWNAISANRAECGVFAIYGSGAAETDFDSTSGTSTSVSRTIDVPSGGVGFMFEGHDGVGTSVWSGTDTVEATASIGVESGMICSTATNSVAGSKTLTATFTNAPFVAIALSWGP